MENKFTPESLVDTSAKTLRNSAETSYVVLTPLAGALWKTFTLGLDGLVSHFEGLSRLEIATKTLRNHAWKDEYQKRDLKYGKRT